MSLSDRRVLLLARSTIRRVHRALGARNGTIRLHGSLLYGDGHHTGRGDVRDIQSRCDQPRHDHGHVDVLVRRFHHGQGVF